MTSEPSKESIRSAEQIANEIAFRAPMPTAFDVNAAAKIIDSELTTLREQLAKAEERISWLEQQREVECQQKEAALNESSECLKARDKEMGFRFDLSSTIADLTARLAAADNTIEENETDICSLEYRNVEATEEIRGLRKERDAWQSKAIAEMVKYESELSRLRAENVGLRDSREYLWAGVANASGGDWTKETPEWQDAAAKARDGFFSTLDQKEGEPCPQAGEDRPEGACCLCGGMHDPKTSPCPTRPPTEQPSASNAASQSDPESAADLIGSVTNYLAWRARPHEFVKEPLDWMVKAARFDLAFELACGPDSGLEHQLKELNHSFPTSPTHDVSSTPRPRCGKTVEMPFHTCITPTVHPLIQNILDAHLHPSPPTP